MMTCTGSLAVPAPRAPLVIADSHALQVHRLAGAEAFRVVKICDQSNFFGEKAASPADQEDENSQGHRTDDYGYSDL